MKGLLLPTGKFAETEIQEIDVKWDDLKDLLGGWPERVVVGDYRTRSRFGEPYDTVDMYVDEESLFKMGVPYNPRASVLYGVPVHQGTILGTAILLGLSMTEEGPDVASLPDKFDKEFFDKFFGEVHEDPTAAEWLI